MGRKRIKLTFELKNLWTVYSKETEKDIFDLSDSYKDFLNRAKTEREAYSYFYKSAVKNGYKLIEEANSKTKKIIFGNRERAIALVKMGKKKITEGFRLIGAHIDAPRLDLKQKPFFEDCNIAFLKTHYYGGIKKYQWVSRPLALHGVVIKQNGEKINIIIGEDEKDPVFVIPDLLPHLARKAQYGKTLEEIITGEQLNAIAGQKQIDDDKVKEKLVENLLVMIYKKYGIKQEDFISADLELTPAEKARDVGFDRTFIGGYGQDDRICGYTAAKALFEADNEYTSIAFLVDKEEIGSDGPSGAQSNWIYDIVLKLLRLQKDVTDYTVINDIFNISEALSADVNAGVNPMFKDVHELNNAAFSGYGVVVTKFTGSGGKYSTNEATAEFTAKIRNIFNENSVHWQFGELGKVDEGGGGTIAKYISKWGINTIDCGPALLGMHSPFEIVSKADLWETFRAYLAFFNSKR